MSAELEDRFRALCREHDLTYAYSDDHRHYASGRESLNRIIESAKLLRPEVARRIWNEVVDEKVVVDARKDFYWSEDSV